MSRATRIAIIDRDPVFRIGTAAILSQRDKFTLVGEGATAAEAFQICGATRPDIMLMEIQIEGGGIVATESIAKSHPNTKIIILTRVADAKSVAAALGAGASAYVLKDISGAELVDIIEAVQRGKKHVAPALAAQMLLEGNSPDPITPLTFRERQVLECVGQGLTNKEVARQLQLTEKTVKHYMSVIMDKLQVRNRVEAVIIAKGFRPD